MFKFAVIVVDISDLLWIRNSKMNYIAPGNKWVGQRTQRPDGIDKVTGSAQYSADCWVGSETSGDWSDSLIEQR